MPGAAQTYGQTHTPCYTDNWPQLKTPYPEDFADDRPDRREGFHDADDDGDDDRVERDEDDVDADDGVDAVPSRNRIPRFSPSAASSSEESSFFRPEVDDRPIDDEVRLFRSLRNSTLDTQTVSLSNQLYSRGKKYLGLRFLGRLYQKKKEVLFLR